MTDILILTLQGPTDLLEENLITLTRTNATTLLMVAAHPNKCVHRIHISTAYANKSYSTLKRLSYSNHLSIRSAAEFELALRYQEKCNASP